MRLTRNDILDVYFDWMLSLISDDTVNARDYEPLLRRLHYYEFTYTMPMDKNRYQDGLSLRYRFLYSNKLLEYKDILYIYPCSVLEMMVALAQRCEEDIMYDPDVGVRTARWFWHMVQNLGIDYKNESAWKDKIDGIIERFLDRTYERDGKGSLFSVKEHGDVDMRNEEIWYQMNWYLAEENEKEN